MSKMNKMYTATAIEAKLLLLIKNTPSITQNELYASFENQSQAEKAIEGCLVKKITEQNAEKGVFSLTEQGRNLI